MLIRLPHWGLALLVASALWPISTGLAQDTSDAPMKKPSGDPKADRADDMEERSIQRRNREPRPHKIHDADPWKKHPPVWSIKDVTKDTHPYSHPSAPAPGGGHFPGGPTGRFGQPYYYTATSPDTSGTGGGGQGYAGGAQPIGGGYGMVGPSPAAGGYPVMDGMNAGPGYGGGYDAGVGYGPGSAPAMIGPGNGGPGFGNGAGPGYGGAGGYGASYAALPGQLPGDPYAYHFGPGWYRRQEAGHYRFPYYTYRAPWYFPGHPSYNRDTNIPW
jgi:hypothetical protein